MLLECFIPQLCVVGNQREAERSREKQRGAEKTLCSCFTDRRWDSPGSGGLSLLGCQTPGREMAPGWILGASAHPKCI